LIHVIVLLLFILTVYQTILSDLILDPALVDELLTQTGLSGLHRCKSDNPVWFNLRTSITLPQFTQTGLSELRPAHSDRIVWATSSALRQDCLSYIQRTQTGLSGLHQR